MMTEKQKQELIFNNRTYEITVHNIISKSKKEQRPKYKKCLICSDTRYIQRHHIERTITIPLCPLHHSAVHRKDIDIRLKKLKGEK